MQNRNWFSFELSVESSSFIFNNFKTEKFKLTFEGWNRPVCHLFGFTRVSICQNLLHFILEQLSESWWRCCRLLFSLHSSRFLSFFRRRGDRTSERKAGDRRSIPGVSHSFAVFLPFTSVWKKKGNGCCAGYPLFGCFSLLLPHLRWLKTVSSTYIWMGRYNRSLSLDATIMVSKNCPIIGEHVVIIFLTQ